MTFQDNREFIEALEKTGDVVRIKQEVDWELEAGAITRRTCEIKGPAVLFENVKDYPAGYRIFGAPMATYRRIAIAAGLPADTTIKELTDEYERRQREPIPPVVVTDGPCKDNKMLGEEVDLFRFPAPMIHDGDGGRYIGTLGVCVTQDPDSGWTNWGTYRFMIVSPRVMTGNPTPASHLALMFKEKFLSKNKPMPIALVIGVDPISNLVAYQAFRLGQSEADIAGALRKQPVEIIKCETNDLMVPAHAEIVIEGQILPDAVTYEGPFGEYTGYSTSGQAKHPVFLVQAITYRNDPILTLNVHGIPADEGQVGAAMGAAIGLRNLLKKRGLPVNDVYLPPEGASHLVIVSVTKGGSEVVKAVKDAMTVRRAWFTKLIVVNDDVDIYNLDEVIHALSVKNHSYRGIFLSEEVGRGGPVTPAYTEEERQQLYGAVATFDATWPADWDEKDIPRKSSFATIYPEEIQQKVLDNWTSYGF